MTVTRRFVTTGTHCPSCSMLIQMELDDVPGVVNASVDHRTSIAEVVFDDASLSEDDIIAAITKAGYGAEALAD